MSACIQITAALWESRLRAKAQFNERSFIDITLVGGGNEI